MRLANGIVIDKETTFGAYISSLTFLRLSFRSVLAAFMACPKALKSYFAVGLFAIFIHPLTFYCSSFLLNMSIQFYFIAIIVHISALAIIRISDYNYDNMVYRKDRDCYGIYVLPRSS